jgi:hypothetical protein
VRYLPRLNVLFASLVTTGLVLSSVPAAEPVPAQAQSVGQPASLVLDGSGAAEVPASADLNLTAGWTVELWLKDEDPAGFDHAFRYLINKGDGVAAEAPYYVLLGNGSILVGQRTNGANVPLTYNLHPAGYSPKIWQHVAATFVASTRVLTLFINGTQVAQQVQSTQTLVGNSLSAPPSRCRRRTPVRTSLAPRRRSSARCSIATAQPFQVLPWHLL